MLTLQSIKNRLELRLSFCEILQLAGGDTCQSYGQVAPTKTNYYGTPPAVEVELVLVVGVV